MSFYVAKHDTITTKAIVLDIDETLINASTDMELLKISGIMTDPKLMKFRNRIGVIHINDVLTSRGSGTLTDLWFVKRPYLREFLIFCFAYFRVVVIWSAGADKYVKSIVRELFKDIKPPVVTYTRLNSVEIAQSVFTKPLRKLMEEQPDLAKFMTLKNTLILDDKTVSFQDNPDNGVLIPRFDPVSGRTSRAEVLSGLMMQDIALLQFKEWLTKPKVICEEDVRVLDKSKIFVTPLGKEMPKKP